MAQSKATRVLVTPTKTLAAVIGPSARPHTDVTEKIWDYIKRNDLQDKKHRRMINADDKLRPVFGGKSQVSMFEMTKLVNRHLSVPGVTLEGEGLLRAAFPSYLKLDPDAQRLLDEVIHEGAQTLGVSPHRLSEAHGSMRKLARHLERQRSIARSTSITEQQLVLALADLCPLFPIC